VILWGQDKDGTEKRDFNSRTPSQQAYDADAPGLREDLAELGCMTEWSLKGPAGFDKATVYRYCVDTTHKEVAAWQRVRLSMKGKDTHEKLAILKAWWDKHSDGNFCKEHSCFVQVYNYLGALRRGGQLDDQNRVRKLR